MNKLDFLRRLDRELGILDKEEKKEILAFYEERFYSGTIYENKTEEEVISELESPEIIARNVLAEYGVSPKYVKTKEDRYTGINSGQLLVLILFDVFIVSWLLPTLYSIVVALFSSLTSYVSVIGLMIGAHSVADEFLFAFATGGYILLFLFGLLVLEVSIYVTKKILIYHMNVMKYNNREKIVKKLHKFSVEAWFKKHRTASNLKTIMFIGAIVVMAYSGYHLFLKEGRLISQYTEQTQITDVYTENLSADVTALESWSIVTDLETLSVQIVPVLGTDLTITHTYKDSNGFELTIDETTNTITVNNSASLDVWSWGDDFRDILGLFGQRDSLIIEVPVDLLLGDVDIVTLNGDIELLGLELDGLDVYTANGEIRLDTLIIGSDVTLATSNGEINIQDIIGKYDLYAETANGRIYIKSVEFTKYYLDTANGSIILKNLNVEDQDGLIIEAETSNGNIVLEDVYVANVTLDTSLGNIDFHNTDLTFVVINLDMETSLGEKHSNVD